MRAYDLYADFLRELEHWQAPVVEPHEFTYLFNRARQRYVEELRKAFEVSQEVTDAMRPLAIVCAQLVADGVAKVVDESVTYADPTE